MATSSWFTRFASMASRATGRAGTFALAALVIVAWAVTGPMFHYSNTWQLIINTGTTIVTFLMVFLIQNTQNRDSQAMHLKMDEIIRAIEGAHNGLLDLEDTDEEMLDKITRRYRALAEQARRTVAGGVTTGEKAAVKSELRQAERALDDAIGAIKAAPEGEPATDSNAPARKAGA